MLRIGIIVGSTRPGRKADAVAKWVYEFARTRSDAEFEIVDVADFNLPLLDEAIPPLMAKYQNAHTLAWSAKNFNLPLLDEAIPPLMAKYQNAHTLAWSAKIAEFDGYVFVTPEYNHGTSGALKNAIDFLWKEWNQKAAGFVSYGGAGGARAAEQLRLVMGELMVADVRAQVSARFTPCSTR